MKTKFKSFVSSVTEYLKGHRKLERNFEIILSKLHGIVCKVEILLHAKIYAPKIWQIFAKKLFKWPLHTNPH